MDLSQAKRRIDISKKHGTAGDVHFEGLRHDDDCFNKMQSVAVGSGKITSAEQINHDDDNPVHDIGFVNG